MAKRIIVLDSPTPGQHRCALWADVPVARRPFYVAGPSAWKDASVAENNDLAAGVIAERVETLIVDHKEGAAAVRVALETLWARWQQHVTDNNPWQRYGSFWDGTVWTPGGVA